MPMNKSILKICNYTNSRQQSFNLIIQHSYCSLKPSYSLHRNVDLTNTDIHDKTTLSSNNATCSKIMTIKSYKKSDGKIL